MKKLSLLMILVLSATMLMAGGLVTNTNHSADFIRMLNRNASTGMDAVYFNPAAAANLPAGMHLYLSSQTIWQDRSVTVFSDRFNSEKYEGSTFAPVFPNFYFTYSTGKLALSAGFQPVGGGGSAEFPNSLPSFDRELAQFVGLPAGAISSLLAGFGTITGYDMDASFTGSSIYFGFQGNAAYKLSDMISVAAGVRYVTASNSYEGSLANPTLIAENGSFNPLPVTELTVESSRSGSGMTFIGGANITLGDMGNIGLRYETLTPLVLTSETTEDGTDYLDGVPGNNSGMFPDATEYNSDMPAMLATGLQYHLTPSMRLQASYNMYFNTAVNWDGLENTVENGYEYGLGAEMDLSPSLTVSAGYLTGDNGATDDYQTDVSYAINSYTLGGGAVLKLSPSMAVQLGVSSTFYETATNGEPIDFRREDYDKSTLDVAVGLSKSF